MHNGRLCTFFFIKLQTPVTVEVNDGVCWWWGYPHSADLRSRRLHAGSAPKRIGVAGTERERKRGGEWVWPEEEGQSEQIRVTVR